MRDFQQKKRWRRLVQSWPVLIFLSILLLFFAWGIIGLMMRMQTTRENRQLAETKLLELQKKKEIFTADVAKLESESGIEETIREKFPVVKEGEGLIVVVDEKVKIEEPKIEEKGFFSKLFFWR
jgi:cell division protein FtsB